MNRIYFAAVCKPSFGDEKDAVKLVMVRSRDCLPPNVWRYMGRMCTTKKRVRENSRLVLRSINKAYNTNFKKLEVL